MMATKKSRRIVKTTRRTGRGAAQPWFVRVLAKKWFLNTVFILMILGVVALVVERIWSSAAKSATFRVNTAQWTTPIPAWIKLSKKTLSARMAQDDFLKKSHSIFEKDLEKNVAARYETLPWIRKVASIAKEYPNTLDIEVEWRAPVARVRLPGREYLLDGDGVALDPVYYDESKLDYSLLVIEGAASPTAGKPWPGEDAAAAAKMAQFLQPLLKDLRKKAKDNPDPITAIDMKNFGDPRKSAILLRTAGGKFIKWGNAPGKESPNEPAASTKLKNLQKLYNDSPGLTSYKDHPLQTWISLHWEDDAIWTSDQE
jgi:hypothetical protein